MAQQPLERNTQAIMFDPKSEREAQRKRQLAEILVAQGNQPLRNEQAGGMTVARSPWENINQAAQKYMGEYQLGKADEAEAEGEQRRQQMMQEALAQWGSDPQAAAAILGQDPRTSEMAAKILQGEIDYGRQQARWNQQDALARELAQTRAASSGGNTPAPMQIANQMFALEQAMNNPALPENERFLAERQYNLLGQAAKTYGFDRGLQAGGMAGYDAVFGGGMQPVTMMPNGEMQAPSMGGQVPSAPLNPMQFQELGQQQQFDNLIGGLTGQQQDPAAAHAAAVQAQQQQIGVSPMQRPDLRSPIGMREIQGYGQAAANIAAQKKEAEAGAASRGKFNEEGRQGLIRSQRLLQARELQNNMIDDKISSIRDRANGMTTGFGGSLMSSIPGTPAYDLRADVETLLANAGFDRLQEMRDNSPTGGALGQVSNIELGLLQSAAQNLQNSQTKDQFIRNLDAFQRQRESSLANIRAAYEQDYQRFGGAQDQFLPAPQAVQPPSGMPQRDQIMQTLRAAGATQDEIEAYLHSRGL